jgi:hypothetical protein
MLGLFPSNFITRPFQYIQIANLVDCPLLPQQAYGVEFANFIVRPHNTLISANGFTTLSGDAVMTLGDVGNVTDQEVWATVRLAIVDPH